MESYRNGYSLSWPYIFQRWKTGSIIEPQRVRFLKNSPILLTPLRLRSSWNWTSVIDRPVLYVLFSPGLIGSRLAFPLLISCSQAHNFIHRFVFKFLVQSFNFSEFPLLGWHWFVFGFLRLEILRIKIIPSCCSLINQIVLERWERQRRVLTWRREL